MNLPAPHLALARSDRFYELGESLRERGPEILQAAQDPANLLLGGTALAGGLAAALAAPKLAGGCWSLLHKALYADPGGVLLGTTKGRWGVTRPVYLSLADRLMHLQPLERHATTADALVANALFFNGKRVVIRRAVKQVGRLPENPQSFAAALAGEQMVSRVGRREWLAVQQLTIFDD